MKTALAAGLFIAAVLAFFLLGQSEKRHSNSYAAKSAAVIEEANRSIDEELSKENAGHPANPTERTVFLAKQKRILAAARGGHPGAPATAPAAAPAPPGIPTSVGASRESATAIDSYMPLIVTVVLGIFAMGLILTTGKTPDNDARKWAFAALGTIVGFWLRQQ